MKTYSTIPVHEWPVPASNVQGLYGAALGRLQGDTGALVIDSGRNADAYDPGDVVLGKPVDGRYSSSSIETTRDSIKAQLAQKGEISADELQAQTVHLLQAWSNNGLSANGPEARVVGLQPGRSLEKLVQTHTGIVAIVSAQTPWLAGVMARRRGETDESNLAAATQALRCPSS